MTAAMTQTQWVVRLKCSLLISEVTQLYDTFEATTELSASGALSASDPFSIPCRIVIAGQGLVNTWLVLQCSTSNSIYGSKIKTLLSDKDLATLPEQCRESSVIVARDVVAHSTAVVTQPVSGYWHLDRIDQRSLPMNNQYTYNRTGAGVTIYIVDTGTNANHNDFGGRATNAANFAGDGNAADLNGHGTHCMGIAGGSTYGVAKEATLVSEKCLDASGSGTFSAVSLALEDITDKVVASPHSAVVSMSLAGGLYTPIHDQISDMVNIHKIAVVVAAGNSADDACNYSPAAAADALTIAASTTQDKLADFSNAGSCTDLAAPGVNIVSASYSSNSGTAIKSGTSMG